MKYLLIILILTLFACRSEPKKPQPETESCVEVTFQNGDKDTLCHMAVNISWDMSDGRIYTTDNNDWSGTTRAYGVRSFQIIE